MSADQGMRPNREPHDAMQLGYRVAVLAALGFWLGGFTFYATVVIPCAERVLGSHLAAGFITQQVSRWLNGAGMVAILLLMGTVLPGRHMAAVASDAGSGAAERRWRLALTSCLGLLALAQLALVVLHPALDRRLDAPRAEIIDHHAFSRLHHVYLWIVTAQWCVGMAALVLLLRQWRACDRQPLPAAVRR